MKSKKKKILTKDEIINCSIGLILILISLILTFMNRNKIYLILFIPALINIMNTLKLLLSNNEYKERYIISKLVNEKIKEYKNKLSKDEIDSFKFKYDPIFHDNIVSKVHKNEDIKHKKNINELINKKRRLEKSKEREIKKITNNRWENITRYFYYNMTEGRIKIEGKDYLFSDIKGAEINQEDGCRIITKTTGKTNSKKHSSLTGGILGATIAGPVGAVVGGSVLGKTDGKVNTTTTSESIPTCEHLGIIVNLNGFKSEITLISSTIDQSDYKFTIQKENAKKIVEKLHILSQTPVPKKILKVEKENTVVEFDKEIKIVEKKLIEAKKEVPKYVIPEKYTKSLNKK